MIKKKWTLFSFFFSFLSLSKLFGFVKKVFFFGRPLWNNDCPLRYYYDVWERGSWRLRCKGWLWWEVVERCFQLGWRGEGWWASIFNAIWNWEHEHPIVVRLGPFFKNYWELNIDKVIRDHFVFCRRIKW